MRCKLQEAGHHFLTNEISSRSLRKNLCNRKKLVATHNPRGREQRTMDSADSPFTRCCNAQI
jgi:hypothetical protein